MSKILATILLVTFTGCSASNSAEDDATTVLEFSPNEIVITESGMTPLTLVNHGKSSVEVASINTTCGCTLPAGFKGLSLAPGESSVIEFKVTLPTHGKKKVHVTAVTATAAKITALATLQLRGPEPETPRLLDKPSLVAISGRNSDERAEGYFSVITVEEASEQWIQSAVSTDEGIEVAIVDVRELGRLTASAVRRAYDFRILAPTPSDPGQSIQSTIELKTSGNESAGGQLHDLFVNVKTKFIPSVRALPEKVVIKTNTSTKHVLTLLFDDPGDWKVDVVEDLKFLTVKSRSSNARLKTFDVLIDEVDQSQINNSRVIKFLCSNANEKFEVVVPLVLPK